MSEPSYGATHEEWTHWADTLRLREDLLPVVCAPGRRIASGSKLKSYGKVPSLYTHTGEVVGIAKWTSKHATVEEVRAWHDQPDFGICLQTRRVRAIDVDITNPGLAAQVRETLDDWATQHGVTLSYRTRADSSKFLLLIELEGSYGKRIITTRHGIIEFLADGQQCLVAGTHKDGSRYEWDKPVDRRLLSPTEFQALWDLLALSYATEEPTESRPRVARSGEAVPQLRPIDDVAVLLHAKGIATGEEPDGRVHFTCPWKDTHSGEGDVTETTYFAANTGGYEQGSFKCLHAHCDQRTRAEFLDAIGWTLEGFEVEADDHDSVALTQSLAAFGCTDEERLAGSRPTSENPPPPPLAVPPGGRSIKTGIIIPSKDCIVAILERPDLTGLHLVKDTFNDTLLIGPTTSELRLIQDVDFTRIGLTLVKHHHFDRKIHTPTVREAVYVVAENHSIDAGLLWAATLPEWDGIARVDRFYAEYLGAEDTETARDYGRYQWTAMAGRLLDPGCQVDMVPVWVGQQGSGKTSAVRSLVVSDEHYTEINLTDDHKDIARSMRGVLVAELSELRGLRGREQEWIKAFISKRIEKWTPKYMEREQSFKRRLVFIGTTNQTEFLNDQTGNRRWLPIHVGDRQDVLRIVQDRFQLWAEGIALFRERGVIWEPAQTSAHRHHHDHELVDIWEETVLAYLYEKGLDGRAPIDEPHLRVWDILREALHIESKQATPYFGGRVAGILRRIGYVEVTARVKGKLGRFWVNSLL